MARTQILIQSWGPGTRISVLFANGLNQQSLVSSAAQASEWSERVKFLMKKTNKQTNKQQQKNRVLQNCTKYFPILLLTKRS